MAAQKWVILPMDRKRYGVPPAKKRGTCNDDIIGEA
jgi:hypothetical protein